MKRFNINGICYKDKHYMVNLDSRLEQIKAMIDEGEYFAINRARQYGKTTTLWALKDYLRSDYVVIFISFQKFGASSFEDEYTFSYSLCKILLQYGKREASGFTEDMLTVLKEYDNQDKDYNLFSLFQVLSEMCEVSEKPIVFMIDEVDSASNNRVFLDFLAQLRAYYLDRQEIATFHSVILAGLYDIKNLKLKLRPQEESKYNSPWNIAADFDVVMSFSVDDIVGMLEEYEQEHVTGMDIRENAQLIYDYTSGYPFLVSRICKLLDEKLGKLWSWNAEGIKEAVKELLKEKNTLFDDMVKKLEDYAELRDILYAILFHGRSFPYNMYNHVMNIGMMFGLLKEKDGMVAVANRIFETVLYNLFMSEEVVNSEVYHAALLEKNQFVQDGYLNMERVLEKFALHFTDVYGDCEDSFIEENGRRFFLLYLKPIINGVGNYYVEARTRDMRRTDVVIDYRGQQFVVELKIWRGDEYNRRGEEQLAGYLEDYHLDKGYLLSFNFNKNKQIGMKEIVCDGKRILEVVV